MNELGRLQRQITETAQRTEIIVSDINRLSHRAEIIMTKLDRIEKKLDAMEKK